MPHCKKCNKVTLAEGNACSQCAAPYVSEAKRGMDEALSGSPAEGVIRIICIGHGTYDPADLTFAVPRNVKIRFRVPHEASTWGGNELRVLPAEDRGAFEICKNYRLWALTGSEKFRLPRETTQDGKQFIRGWRTIPDKDNIVYIATPGDSIRLCDIVYGLGGASSLGTGQRWEVIWLACREVIGSHAEFSTRMRESGEQGGITLTLPP